VCGLETFTNYLPGLELVELPYEVSTTGLMANLEQYFVLETPSDRRCYKTADLKDGEHFFLYTNAEMTTEWTNYT
jgi:hypothetical protein